MNFSLVLNLVLGVAAVSWIASRQVRLRPVRERSIAPLVLIAVGLTQIAPIVNAGAVPVQDWLILTGSALLGVAVAAWRSHTVILSSIDGVAQSKGTWVTLVLWLISLVQHLCSEFFLTTPALGRASLLSYLGLVFLAQREFTLLRVSKAGLAPQSRSARRG